MTLKDFYDNSISTTSTKAVVQYDAGMQLFLGANHGAVEAFQAAIQADPEFALGHAALARAQMMAARMPQAKASMQRAAIGAGH